MSELNSKQILARVLDILDTAYGKGLGEDKDKIVLWHGQIAHLNAEAAIEAANRCVANFKWLPSLSEYLEVARQVRRHQEDAARPPVRRLEAHIAEMQDKGLSVQRSLVKARVGRKPHDHRNGWAGCAICVDAAAQQVADECATCFLLETHGLKVSHHKG